jgi:hypothetical protein
MGNLQRVAIANSGFFSQHRCSAEDLVLIESEGDIPQRPEFLDLIAL